MILIINFALKVHLTKVKLVYLNSLIRKPFEKIFKISTSAGNKYHVIQNCEKSTTKI
jgi:hypothetical protein